MAPEAPPAHPVLRCIVKLGGAAITVKHEFETLDGPVLATTATQIASVFGPGIKGSDVEGAAAPEGVVDGEEAVDGEGVVNGSGLQHPGVVVVHGAGSFGHFQAKQYRVHEVGLRSNGATEGFVLTRISVTRLNQMVVQALSKEGVPAVGVSPFAGGWTMERRELLTHNAPQVAAMLDSGLVPVLHGDAVIDAAQGCTILSGDVIIRQLALNLRPQYVVFLTNVAGVFNKPPNEDGAFLIHEIGVNPDLSYEVTNPSDGASAVELDAAHHDTTGGMATKIAEAASIAAQGVDVYIAKAGTNDAEAALRGDVQQGWTGTIVRAAGKRPIASDT